MSDTSPKRVAYSYLRYSSPTQGDGDSVRRQTTKAREWCERTGTVLDGATYCDTGVSAFKGENRESGVLAAFLRDVEAERIPRGSVLLIENMDRLSREPPVRAVHLLSGILLAGISVVTLVPEEQELNEKSDLFSLFRGQMSQARGHDESKTKSERVTEAWDQRKLQARKGNGILTRRLPGWLEERDGKVVGIPDRVQVVRKIFDLASKGRGLSLIVRALEEDQVTPWGGAVMWRRSYISKILNARTVLGECQFYKGDEPDGEPIAGYFPKVIDEPLFSRVQGALAARKKSPGRVGKKVANLFTGLLWDAHSRGKMLISWRDWGRGQKRHRFRVLIPAKVLERGVPGSHGFRNDIFEEAVLTRLKEIDPKDVTGEEPQSESAALAEELAGLDARMKAIEAELAGDGTDVPALVRVLRAIDSKRQDALKRLTAARRADENPLSGVWSEARTLLDAAQDEPGRLRLRSLLQAAVSEVWVLVVRTAKRVYCVAQIHFRSGIHRDVLINYRPATRVRAMSWSAVSGAWPTEAGEIDLRKSEDVRAIEKMLEALDVTQLGG
ncbi:recombinase family protein [Gemmata sp. G18]|uniref:Recombinase family protein n=1 Tax=Gemmata palustris TaxID=2822762 RepID=A0ABS5BP93_9BACT|nr:recombinase family protein [Gemmata palustris]MBP3955485.1 recombinase family protein [Gemmata palustris]